MTRHSLLEPLNQYLYLYDVSPEGQRNPLIGQSPNKIVDEMRYFPSHQAYNLGKEALAILMQGQRSRRGVERVNDDIASFEQAKLGWELHEDMKDHHLHA